MSIKYKTVPIADRPDHHWIQIQEGQFKGVRYTYGPISVGEKPTENGTLPISFTYLLDGSQDIEAKDLGHLKEVMGEILHDILLQMAENVDKLQDSSEVIDIPDLGE
jgi:hypothetical protein